MVFSTREKYIVDIVECHGNEMQADYPFTLPDPDDPSRQHSERVAHYIRDSIIADGGSISFAEFMQLTLYAPALGYYVAGNRKFGDAGDFVTAPEVSPLFARVLATQAASVLNELGAGGVLELGAGSGAMAVDMLGKMKELGVLPERYCILEVSPELQQRQRQRVRQQHPDDYDRFEWLDQLPRQFTGVVVANEVADALPVERFVRTPDGVKQLRVACGADGFEWLVADAPSSLTSAVENIEQDIDRQLEDQYRSEISLGLGTWVRDICRCLRSGFVFLCDYGVSRREYYAPDRSCGWLRCHYRHRAHDDPLILPGIQDVTAWVDFTAVAEAASSADMEIAGWLSQSQFLMNSGLEQELEELTSLSTAGQVDLSRQVKILTLPGEMGENFKCIGLASAGVSYPSGFAFGDRAHVL